ncbi:hypothetical protein R3P38DRAFT_3203590 [Favolaschia claudopus]|uniref:Uncharacterized protein n=1 Tax=Favolaschia claudopus TaxID=2862362 RepID=A0AAW0ATG6_9AGAR
MNSIDCLQSSAGFSESPDLTNFADFTLGSPQFSWSARFWLAGKRADWCCVPGAADSTGRVAFGIRAEQRDTRSCVRVVEALIFRKRISANLRNLRCTYVLIRYDHLSLLPPPHSPSPPLPSPATPSPSLPHHQPFQAHTCMHTFCTGNLAAGRLTTPSNSHRHVNITTSQAFKGYCARAGACARTHRASGALARDTAFAARSFDYIDFLPASSKYFCNGDFAAGRQIPPLQTHSAVFAPNVSRERHLEPLFTGNSAAGRQKRPSRLKPAGFPQASQAPQLVEDAPRSGAYTFEYIEMLPASGDSARHTSNPIERLVQTSRKFKISTLPQYRRLGGLSRYKEVRRV